jgi:hypothetical protein
MTLTAGLITLRHGGCIDGTGTAADPLGLTRRRPSRSSCPMASRTHDNRSPLALRLSLARARHTPPPAAFWSPLHHRGEGAGGAVGARAGPGAPRP